MIKDRATPWAYRKGHSRLHRIDAGLKLLALLALSGAAFLPVRPPLTLGCLALFLVLAALSAGVRPWTLLRGSAPLLTFVLAAALFQGTRFSPPGFDPSGLGAGGLFAARIAVSFMAGSLFFQVTTAGEIQKSLARAEDALRIRRFRPSLAIALMLGFLPRFFEAWEAAETAWDSRAGRKGAARVAGLVPLVIETMLEKAAETAEAMEARGAGLDEAAQGHGWNGSGRSNCRHSPASAR